jgi:signal transduction histidine kinase
MKDEDKTNKQLMIELEKLRQRITEFEMSETERKRTDDALRESELELSISNRIAEVFLSVPDDEMYGEVLEVVLDAMKSKYGVFGYIEEDGALVCPSMTRDIWEQCLMADKDIVFPRETWGGIWGRALTEKRTLYSNKLLCVPEGHISILRALTVPIVHRGEVIGVLLVGNKATDYEEKDKEMLEKIADRIAPILHARLQKERQEKERKRVESELRKRTHDLGERVKELNCLFGISKLIERQDLSSGELFLGIVNLIPPSWQYPEITGARLMLEDQEFRTENFRETIWRQTRLINVHGERIGTVEVCYLEERPEADEGPFLQEERSLLNAIAERLGRVLERKRAEEGLQDAYDHLEMQVKLRTAELAEANEKLRKEIAERKRMEEALRKSSEKLKSFAYSVIHDLKSPSIGIYGLTERLNKHYRDILDEKGRSYCDQIIKASVHIAALIEEITVYIESKESPLKIEETNTKEILQIIRDEFAPRLTIRGIEWFEPETVVNIKADRLSMLRVFRNFVDNTLKYGGDALSEIRIGYEESDEFHTFSVTDDGAGISGGDYEKIFGLFSRDESSKAIEGAGLGLAIVRELAERHRGRVWAEPGREKGTTFYISVSKSL